MFTEAQVVDFMVQWLKSTGYSVMCERKGTSKGHDIEAQSKDGKPIFIECKGAISPKNNNSFSMHYKWQCASGAVFNQLKLRAEQDSDIEIGIALPEDKTYRYVLGALPELLNQNNVSVFWVSADGTVSKE